MSDGAGKRFDALVATMHTLRAPGGCPWDAEQTHASLKPYVIEEAHEVCDAIDSGKPVWHRIRGESALRAAQEMRSVCTAILEKLS